MSIHILLVEDDYNTRIMLACRLQYAGYRVTQASDGETAIDLLEKEIFDIVLTDIILGDIDGIEVLQTARQQDYRPEVILLTGHGSLDTSVAALRSGAYDYLLKPCDAEKLLLSVEGAVKRHLSEQRIREAAVTMIHALDSQDEQQYASKLLQSYQVTKSISRTRDNTIYTIGELLIGQSRHEVFFAGEQVMLTPIEYELLSYLAERRGDFCSFSEIIRHTHGLETPDSEAQAMLRSHIRNLRRKIPSTYLVNDRGVGYKLIDPDETQVEEM